MKYSSSLSLLLLVCTTLSFVSCSKREITTSPTVKTSVSSNEFGRSDFNPNSKQTDWKSDIPKVEDTLKVVNNTLKEEPVYRSCIARATQMCDSEALARFTQEKDSDEICKAFNDESMRNTCTVGINTELAKRKKDISFCEKLSDTEKISCKQQVIILKAKEVKDTKICNELLKDGSGSEMASSQCVTQVLLSTWTSEKKADTCNDIKSESARANCIMMTKNTFDAQTQKNTWNFVPPSFGMGFGK